MKQITSLEQLNECIDASKDGAVFIFKHSTACPISTGAHDKVARYAAQKSGDGQPPFYVVKVIESRPISNEIEARLSVRHQSPQLILVKDGVAAWSASHYGIHAEAIEQALAK